VCNTLGAKKTIRGKLYLSKCDVKCSQRGTQCEENDRDKICNYIFKVISNSKGIFVLNVARTFSSEIQSNIREQFPKRNEIKNLKLEIKLFQFGW
jgi:hypothetical protein